MRKRKDFESAILPALAVSLVWLCIPMVYSLGGQWAIPWFEVPGFRPPVIIWLVTILGVLTACACPQGWIRRTAWLVVAAVSFVGLARLHSWLGPTTQIIPLIFVILAFDQDATNRQRELLLSSVCSLILACLILNQLNASFLSGFEFVMFGQFQLLFPAEIKNLFHADSELAPRVARVGIQVEILWFLLMVWKPRRGLALTTLILFALSAVRSVLLLGVVQMIGLLAWAGRRTRIISHSLHWLGAYVIVTLAFFSWYLLDPARGTSWLFVEWLLVAPMILPVVWELWRDSSPEEDRKALILSTRWGTYFAAIGIWLVAPLIVEAIPSPFGATAFSARDALYPPKYQVIAEDRQECRYFLVKLASRWGYHVRLAEGDSQRLGCVYPSYTEAGKIRIQEIRSKVCTDSCDWSQPTFTDLFLDGLV